MKMRVRTLRVLLCIVLLAAPALALAGVDACPPCCDHASASAGEMPCHGESLQEGSCCQAPPGATAEPAKRGVEVPGVSLAGLATASSSAWRNTPRPLEGRWWLHPDRLSVVRRL